MEIGSIVQLKSGGPNMTVEGFLSDEDGKNYLKGYIMMLNRRTERSNNPYVICRWFDNNSSYKENVFTKSTLEEQI